MFQPLCEKGTNLTELVWSEVSELFKYFPSTFRHIFLAFAPTCCVVHCIEVTKRGQSSDSSIKTDQVGFAGVWNVDYVLMLNSVLILAHLFASIRLKRKEMKRTNRLRERELS